MSDWNPREVTDAAGDFHCCTDVVDKFQIPKRRIKSHVPKWRTLLNHVIWRSERSSLHNQCGHLLSNCREWCGRIDTLLIVDEVMTGFGRTGRMFASEHESVVPDMMVLGKGLTGGYLPLAVTLISEKLFLAFSGSVAEGKALAYGHSYTGNALGCAAAKASLEVFEKESVLEALQPKIRDLSSALAGLRELPGVKEVRQCGFIAGVEMQDSLEAAGPAMAAAVCIEARRHGLLTRPISNVVVLMPPLCITIAQLTKAVEALRASITEVWRCSKPSARKDAEEVAA